MCFLSMTAYALHINKKLGCQEYGFEVFLYGYDKIEIWDMTLH